MKRFRCGQIWLVNFDPSFGHEYRKVRPALIISSDTYIESGSLLTVIPFSSQVAKKTESDILVSRNSDNRLMSDSLLKVRQISSFDKRRFIKFVGVVGETLGRVERAVSRLLF